MGGRPGGVEITIGLAIDGEGWRTIEGCARLPGTTLDRDVRAAAENLDLGQGKPALLAGKSNANETWPDRALADLNLAGRRGLEALFFKSRDLFLVREALEPLGLRDHLEGRALIAPVRILALVPDGKEPVVFFL